MKRLSFIYCFLLVSSFLCGFNNSSVASSEIPNIVTKICTNNASKLLSEHWDGNGEGIKQTEHGQINDCYTSVTDKLRQIKKQTNDSDSKKEPGWGEFLRIQEVFDHIEDKDIKNEDLSPEINNDRIEEILIEKEKYAKKLSPFIESFNSCYATITMLTDYDVDRLGVNKFNKLQALFSSEECKAFDKEYMKRSFRPDISAYGGELPSDYEHLESLRTKISEYKEKTCSKEKEIPCVKYINDTFFSTITNADNSGSDGDEEKDSEVNPSENSLIGSCSDAKNISEECKKPDAKTRDGKLSYVADLVPHLGKDETVPCNRGNLVMVDDAVDEMCKAKKGECEKKCQNKLDEFKTAFAMCFFHTDFKNIDKEQNQICKERMEEIKEKYKKAINNEESNPSLEVSELVTCKVVEDEEILGVSNDIARSEKIGMCKDKSDYELNLLRRGIRPEQINQAGSQSGSGIPTGGTNGNEYSDDSDFWTGGSLGDQSLTSSSSDGSNVFFKPGEPTPLGGTLFTHDPNSVTSAGDEVAESGEEGRLEGESSEEDVATKAEELDSQVGDAPGLHEDGDVSVAGNEENKKAQSGTEENVRRIAGRRSSRRVEKVGKGGRVGSWSVSRGGGYGNRNRNRNIRGNKSGDFIFGLAGGGSGVFNATQYSGGSNNPSGKFIIFFHYSKELKEGICAANGKHFACYRKNSINPQI